MKRFSALIFSFLAMVVIIATTAIALAAERSALVVFSADWCASCREVIPIVRDIGNRNNMNVVVINVDAQDAPRQAKQYGLSIPANGPPQVYMVDGGRVSLVYSGRDFRFGFEDVVRSTINENLRRAN